MTLDELRIAILDILREVIDSPFVNEGELRVRIVDLFNEYKEANSGKEG